MKFALSLPAALATLLAHAVALTAIIASQSGSYEPAAKPQRISVVLVPAITEPVTDLHSAASEPAPPSPLQPPKDASFNTTEQTEQKAEPTKPSGVAVETKPTTNPRRSGAAKPALPEKNSKSKPGNSEVARPLSAAAAPTGSTTTSSPQPSAPPQAVDQTEPAGGSFPGPQSSAPATVAHPVRTPASPASYAASNRKPPYPRLSRSSGEQGTVILRVLVQADGTVGAVEIGSSSGFPLLDESARSTVRSWRFEPATIDGKPVPEWYRIPIPFTLREP